MNVVSQQQYIFGIILLRTVTPTKTFILKTSIILDTVLLRFPTKENLPQTSNYQKRRLTESQPAKCAFIGQKTLKRLKH